MVRVSYDQKPYRRALMEAFGASVTSSPSLETDSGRAILAQFPDTNGSLGIAISEAVEVAAQGPQHTSTPWGSVLNHVLPASDGSFGLEAIEQMALADDEPDVIVACTGADRTLPAWSSLPGQEDQGRRHTRACGVSSPRPARASPRATLPTTSATPAT